MSSVFVKSVSAVVALSIAVPTFAAESWYERHAEGWHWYNDPEKIEEVEPEIVPEHKEEPKKEPPKPKMMVPEPAKPKHPVAFSSEWLNTMIPKYLSRAVDDPTPENVEAFFLLQRLAMDKAERFQKMAEQVRVGNRFIDESERRPVCKRWIVRPKLDVSNCLKRSVSRQDSSFSSRQIVPTVKNRRLCSSTSQRQIISMYWPSASAAEV